MKRLIILSASFFAFTLVTAQAQSTVNERNNLKGPKAKNQKVGQRSIDQSADIFLMPSDLQGPKAKNTSFADRNHGSETVTSKGGGRILGPKGKNQKHGFTPNPGKSHIQTNALAQK